MFPNFLIIGAMKAATTSISKYMNCHPDIFIPDVKELHYFVEEKNWTKGERWYQSFFDGRKEKYLGEASVSYTVYPEYKGVPNRIKKTIPDVKLIYILRHPVERAFSNYVHDYLVGRDRRDINIAINKNSNYVTRSMYYKQFEQYLCFFDKKSVLILCYDDICNNTLLVIKKIYNFLGLKDKLIIDNLKVKYNVTNESLFYPDFLLKIRKYFPFCSFVSNVMSYNIKKGITSFIEKKYTCNMSLNDLDKENLIQIVTVLKEDIRKFNKYIADDIPCLNRFLNENEEI